MSQEIKIESAPAIVLFRRTLRIVDNLALFEASKLNIPIIPVYIYDQYEDKQGAASKWWLHRSLTSLSSQLKKRNLKLVVRRGSYENEVLKLIEETKCCFIAWNRTYEPSIQNAEKLLEKILEKKGIGFKNFNSSLIIEPERFFNKQGKAYQVYTPFYKAVMNTDVRRCVPAPGELMIPKKWPQGITVSDLRLNPTVSWDVEIKRAWQPGEDIAANKLKQFIKKGVQEYSLLRDYPASEGTSKLSPYLHFGEISPLVVWHSLIKQAGKKGIDIFLKQIIWREFAYYLLTHFPNTIDRPLRAKFEKMPWDGTKKMLRAWQKGETGYPIIDAGMRELWATGWMHNRVRMIVASFLTKDLFVSWIEGARWFSDTLVDADLACNILGWQWVAGCGADAAPYFRIFNPTMQSEKFDPEGDYIKKWVPEISKIDKSYIHRPWEAPQEVLRVANVRLGKDYPFPIVNHTEMRARALALYSRYVAS